MPADRRRAMEDRLMTQIERRRPPTTDGAVMTEIDDDTAIDEPGGAPDGPVVPVAGSPRGAAAWRPRPPW